MTQKGIKRDQVNPAKTVLFGAASGYAVRSHLYIVSILLGFDSRFFSFMNHSFGQSYTR